MATLNARVFEVTMSPTDTSKDVLFSTTFRGATPDFALVQASGADSEIVKSTGYVTRSGECYVSNALNPLSASHVHGEAHAYNLIGICKGSVELIPNGVRITQDLSAALDSFVLSISIVGGVDIRNVEIVKYTDELLAAGSLLDMPFNGANLSFVMAGSGRAQETVVSGFFDSHGYNMMPVTSGSSPRDIINSGYIAYTRYSDQYTPDQEYRNQSMVVRHQANVTGTYADLTVAARSGIQPAVDGQVGYDTRMTHGQIYTPAGTTNEVMSVTMRTNGVSGLSGGLNANDFAVYMLVMDFDYEANDNLTFHASPYANPYTRDNWHTGTSTRDTPEVNDPYKIGGQDTANWPTADVASGYSRMTQKPVTFGIMNMCSGTSTNSVGSAAHNFMYSPEGSHGVGYSLDSTAQTLGNSARQGFPTLTRHTKPDFPNPQPTSNHVTGYPLIGNNLTGIHDSWRWEGGDVIDPELAEAGSYVGEMRQPSTVHYYGYAYISWDKDGTITEVSLADPPEGSPPTTGYLPNRTFQVIFSRPGFSRFYVYCEVSGVDGLLYASYKGVHNQTRDMYLHNDGAIELTQEGGAPWSYEQNLWEAHIIMCASDGTPNPCDGGEIGPDGLITFIDRRKLRDGIRNCNLDYNFAVLASKFAAGIGAQGPAGPDGVDGTINNVTGPTGPVGEIGSTGQTGATGSIGPDGVIGIQGPLGSYGTIDGGTAYYVAPVEPIIEGGGA